MKATTLADLIEGQRVHKTTPDENVRTACIAMASANIGALPVVDRRDTLVGILSERDVIQRSVIVYRPSATTLVKQVMTPNPQWLGPDAKLDEAYHTMIKGKFRHLPVCEDGRLLGVVSIRDFIPQNSSLVERLLRRTAVKQA